MSNPTPFVTDWAAVTTGVLGLPESSDPDGSVAVFTDWTPFTYERADGSQILVAVQPDGTVHVAERSGPSRTWGPPLDLVDR